MADADYLIPLLILFGFAVAMAAGIVIASAIVGPKTGRDSKKLSTYECGMPLLDKSRKRLSVKYFVIAAIFLLFDLEIAFLYPWAYVFRGLDSMATALAEMFIFLGILFLGYLYIWKKGALDWQ